MKIKASLILTVAALALSGSALAEVKIALVAKSLGNGFFEAANVGAQEAAKELGDVKVIYTGPTTTTAEAQIEVLNGLIAQGVDAIAISANDPDAVVPVLKKAMQRGIKVVSWDSGVAKAGRQIHLNPSNQRQARRRCPESAERGERRCGGAERHANLDQPEHLDCGDEKGAAEVPVRQSGDGGLRGRSL